MARPRYACGACGDRSGVASAGSLRSRISTLIDRGTVDHGVQLVVGSFDKGQCFVVSNR
jgi:hypothetical protein